MIRVEIISYTLFLDNFKDDKMTQQTIRTAFERYIDSVNITTTDAIQYINHLEFFNTITVNVFGTPKFTHAKSNNSSSKLIYLAGNAKAKLLSDINPVTVPHLYLGVLTNGKLEFNFPNYVDFIHELLILRKKIKTDITTCNSSNKLNIVQLLITTYLNLIYGMLEKPESVLTANIENPREYISETTKIIILKIASFYINRRIPVYYICVDKLFVPVISKDRENELNDFFTNECSDDINTTIANLDIGEVQSAFVLSKKQYICGQKFHARGVKVVDDDEVLTENKKYFGVTYPQIFPEYTL